jgi:beta-lactamase superfamily II metal-dependent hydrolase
MQAAAPILRMIREGWGSERFSSEATSVENEMSVIQYAGLCGDRVVLTGDAGRDGLTEAADFAQKLGLSLPVNKFQAPHHGGRRNVSTEILDRWLGPRLPQILPEGHEIFTAAISSAKEDPDHPRNAVLRALRHRGGFILTTEDRPVIFQRNSSRSFTTVQNVPYPDEQEED